MATTATAVRVVLDAAIDCVVMAVVVHLVAGVVLLGGHHLRAGGPFPGLMRRPLPKYSRLWCLGLVFAAVRSAERLPLTRLSFRVLNE